MKRWTLRALTLTALISTGAGVAAGQQPAQTGTVAGQVVNSDDKKSTPTP